MEELSSFLSFIERVGLPTGFIVLVLWWFKPRAERWFESQCKMFDAVCKRVEMEPEVDKRKLRAIGRVGTMVYEAAPEDRRQTVKSHLDDLHREIEERAK